MSSRVGVSGSSFAAPQDRAPLAAEPSAELRAALPAPPSTPAAPPVALPSSVIQRADPPPPEPPPPPPPRPHAKRAPAPRPAMVHVRWCTDEEWMSLLRRQPGSDLAAPDAAPASLATALSEAHAALARCARSDGFPAGVLVADAEAALRALRRLRTLHHPITPLLARIAERAGALLRTEEPLRIIEASAEPLDDTSWLQLLRDLEGPGAGELTHALTLLAADPHATLPTVQALDTALRRYEGARSETPGARVPHPLLVRLLAALAFTASPERDLLLTELRTRYGLPPLRPSRRTRPR